MRKLVATFAVAIAVFTSFAFAQEDDKKTLLPLNPFATAAEGDWTCYVTKTTDAGKTSSVITVDTITKVSDEGVSVVTETRKDGKKTTGEASVYEKGKKPTFESFFGGEGAFDYTQPHGIKVADEAKKVGDHEFKCKKVTFQITGKKPGKVTVWFSTEVKGSGVVAMSAVADKDGYKEEGECAGFGGKGKADWGKTADDVEKKLK
jgi:hypothetical protein